MNSPMRFRSPEGRSVMRVPKVRQLVGEHVIRPKETKLHGGPVDAHLARRGGRTSAMSQISHLGGLLAAIARQLQAPRAEKYLGPVGVADRAHDYPPKGLLQCSGRLYLDCEKNSRGVIYFCFICLGRRDRSCDMPG